MNKILKTISYSFILSTPLFLNGCDSMDNLFGRSDSSDYTYSQPAPRTTFKRTNPTVNSSERKYDTTRTVEPRASTSSSQDSSAAATTRRAASSSVNNTSSSAATATSVPVNGPTLPSMAPSVSQ